MTDEQLLLLNNLMYLEIDFKEHIGKPISEVLSLVDDGRIKIPDSTLTPKEDWKMIIEGMKQDSGLAQLRLMDTYTDPGGAGMACFEDSSGNHIAVFRGTGGREWPDNFHGGYQTDTLQQQRALEWIESLPYDDITVTGHSKGGNKAQYVSLMSDKVERCISYDGQGFSPEFLEKYAAEIAANRDKITSYALDNDFINILLFDISGNKYYLEGNRVDWFADNHCTDSAFFMGEDGRLHMRITEQSETAEELQGLLNYILNSTSEEQRIDMLSFMGDISQMILGEGKSLEEVLDYALQPEYADEAGRFLAYIFRYEKENGGITDALRDILNGIDGGGRYLLAVNIVDWLLEQEWFNNVVEWTASSDLLAALISRFLEGWVDPGYVKVICQIIENMYRIEGELPYSEDLLEAPSFDLRQIHSAGFGISFLSAGRSASALLEMAAQMGRCQEAIRDARKGISYMGRGSFWSVSRHLLNLENRIGSDQASAKRLGDTLGDIGKLYERTEKRAYSYQV